MAKLIVHVPDDKAEFALQLTSLLGWKTTSKHGGSDPHRYHMIDQISKSEEEAIKMTEWVERDETLFELSSKETQVLDERLEEDGKNDISSQESISHLKAKNATNTRMKDCLFL